MPQGYRARDFVLYANRQRLAHDGSSMFLPTRVEKRRVDFTQGCRFKCL